MPPGAPVGISVGRTIIVPDVVGLKEGSAVLVLDRVGLGARVDRIQVPDRARDDVVLDQSPGPGADVPPRIPVLLRVGQCTFVC